MDALQFAVPSTPLTLAMLFRGLDPGMSVAAVAAFLYICENEGLSQIELCRLMGEPAYAVSRLADYLGDGAARVAGGSRTSGLGLVERRDWGVDGRVRTLALTAEGQALRDRINAVVRAARQV